MTRHFHSEFQKRKAYAKDCVLEGSPELVAEPSCVEDLIEVVLHCLDQKIPITFCGSQTSMTGSSVALKGAAVSLTKLNKILEIGEDQKGPYALCEPGVILGDLKKAVKAKGYFYPPEPTSFKEATVGATVATNATGESTFKYGPTRTFVEELDVVTGTGEVKTLKRTKALQLNSFKNTAGFFLEGEEIDHVIGSEGTLAVITKIKLRLLKDDRPNIFVMVLPFQDLEQAISAVVEIVPENKNKGLLQSNVPQCLELIGPGAAELFAECESCPAELKDQKSFLYLKGEYSGQTDLERTLELWFDDLKILYQQIEAEDLFDKIFIAQTDQQLKDIAECRHYIPLKVNERYFEYNKKGGGKVGTDWWVPLHHLKEMMHWTYEKSKALNIPFLVFAHIGNGHPHWNYLTKNATDKQRAQNFVYEQCEKAVLFGGGVAGEHGIGKIKKQLLKIQHSPKMIQKMKQIKKDWDPYQLLGQGNLFD